MAARKKRKIKKTIPPESRPGRKKDVRRFELEILVGDNGHTAPNEVAFFVRTSGGTPLNGSDTKKVAGWILLQLKLLGHKMRRKGQELDPAPKAPAALESQEPPEETETPPSDLATEESPDLTAAPDGDDSDAHNTPAAPNKE